MSDEKTVSAENAEIYDYLAHEYGYSIEYIKGLDITTIINLIRVAIKRKRKELLQLCNLIRAAVWATKDISESDIPQENNEDDLRKLIKVMTKTTDAVIDEAKEKHIEIPI